MTTKTELLDKIKSAPDTNLPKLEYWNYGACDAHTAVGPQVDCNYQACGGELFAHQRVGIAWLYAVKRGLLADDPGLGKTNQIIGLVCLLKQKDKLANRAIIIPQTPSVGQWSDEFARWAPKLKVIAVDGSITKSKRIALYASRWDVAIVGSHVAISDQEEIYKLGTLDLLASDDVDPLLNHDTATHRAITYISTQATRSFTMNATPIQMRLEQAHAALEPAGGLEVFGPLAKFQDRYVLKEKEYEWVNGVRKEYFRQTGYKKITEFKTKLAPQYLRRRADDVDDINMPDLMPPVTEWLEMSKVQRDRYTELQNGIVRLLREEGTQIKQADALAKWHYGQQICAGLPALKELDGVGASPKLDLLFTRLDGVWSDRKVVVFVKNVGMVRAALARAKNLGIGTAMIWGQQQNKDQRSEMVKRFREDSECRLMVGTTSIQRSLNLQASGTLVGIDTQLNPALVKQLVGRVKRAGSSHKHVYMFNFRMQESQESRYDEVLRRRQALYDVTFGEESEIFEKLPPLQLLSLMRPN